MAASAADTPGSGTRLRDGAGRHPHELGQPAGELVAERHPVTADVLVPLAAGGALAARHDRVDAHLVAERQPRLAAARCRRPR